MEWRGERRKEFHHGETCMRCFPDFGNRVKLHSGSNRFTIAYDPIILRQLNTLLSLGNNKVKCSIARVVSRMVSFQS
jgi:hypothetical protein